jgi:hypothetical protein
MLCAALASALTITYKGVRTMKFLIVELAEFSKGRIAAQTRLVDVLLWAVLHASMFQRANQRWRYYRLRILSRQLKRVYGELGKLSIKYGSTSFRSHRRHTLKDHHRRVIAALKQAETQLDIDPDTASRKLAEMLMLIADRYAQGKLGDLLPSEVLQDVQPARSWETAKMVVTALMVTGIAVAAVLMKLPEAALTTVVGAGGIIAVGLVYGRNARSGFDILDSVRGIQRP